jgi:quinolinate synthase
MIAEEINRLREDALIVAHYYVPGEVQKLADATGDSYYLSKVVRDSAKKKIVFCGVSFMAESAKAMSPEKVILLPDLTAGCPMADMVIPEDIRNVRENFRRSDDLAVVCYINSGLDAKAESDVIVTSSNAVKVVSKLPQKNIYFVPDENLGRYVASKLPEKNLILHDCYCHVHTSIERARLLEAKRLHPSALVLSHPECREEILEISDYIGSTSGIINEAVKSPAAEFIICTEMGVFFDLEKRTEGKKFYSVGHRQLCPSMKKITLEKVLSALKKNEYEVEVDTTLARKAARALEKMHEFAD